MFQLRRLQQGFTLIEMLVIAPIVILAIGAFITVIVNLTGEVLSSRGSNVLTYNLQDALNRIEEDVKLSAGYLATNSIPLCNGSTVGAACPDGSNPQGRGAVNSTTNFTITDPTYGNALILNSYVTNANPIALNTAFVYLANQPNDCNDYSLYSKNRPMTMNIVYFIDSNGTLWRRTIMPADYTNPSTYCGTAPWQQPSCIEDASRSAFCKTNDQKLLENVGTSGFTVNYYSSASETTPLVISGPTTTADLQNITTISVKLSSTTTIAGRTISKSGTMRVSRLDTNASAIGDLRLATTPPAAPTISSSISEGHDVTFTWPQVSGATSYSLRYQVNGGSYSAPVTLDTKSRSYTVSDGWNGDTVQAEVTAINAIGSSSATTNSVTIPVWAPLLLKNGWTDYGSGFGGAAYTKTKTGLVIFRGLIRNNSYVSGQVVVATIPNDYAPDNGQLLFGTSKSPNTSGRFDITPDGDVLLVDGDPAWISLETIRYDLPATATVPYTRTAPSLLNSWANYSSPGPGYAPATYAQDPTSKRVIVQGLVKNGTNTDGTAIFNLPVALQAEYRHMASRSTTWSMVGVSTSVHAKAAGSNAYQSLNTIYYPNSTATWITPTLVNNWVNYGGGFATAGYTRSTNETASGSTGVVSLKGLIRSGSGSANVMTLPVGYRPKNRILYTTGSTGAYSRIDILPTGEVYTYTSNNTWLSLDDIIFLAEQ